MQTAAFFEIFCLFFICFYSQPYVIKATPTRSLAPQIRIVNGREANIEDFPYQLSFRRNGVHICGASALATVWALTAAHCIDGFEKVPMLFSLRAGSSARSYGGILISISSIHKHPSYNAETMNCDVALLRTNQNMLSGDFVVPIKLPRAEEIIAEDTEAVVSGWGHQSSYENVLSNVLKYTTVYTVKQEECAQDMKVHGEITEAMFCAAARRTDACQGDSGGPIQANGTQIGIVSWGVGCADPFYPGVYTRLSYPPIRRWVTLMSKL